jgi:hypothetical protein
VLTFLASMVVLRHNVPSESRYDYFIYILFSMSLQALGGPNSVFSMA